MFYRFLKMGEKKACEDDSKGAERESENSGFGFEVRKGAYTESVGSNSRSDSKLLTM